MKLQHLVLPSLALLLATTSHALIIRTEDATAQNRFDSGFPAAPVSNTSGDFLLSGQDLSGIGWDPTDTRKGFALITPQHFIGATHFAANSSDSITFLNRAGTLKNYGVASVTVIKNENGSNSDLFIGTLDNAISASDDIGFLSVADLGAEALYTGRQIFAYGRTPKVGVGTIGSFQEFGSDPITSGSGLNPSRTYQFTYNTIVGGGNDAYFEVGDSGSPSFTLIDGQIAITGTHSALASAGTLRVNYDTFVPNYIDQLNAALDGSGYQLTTVPEPASWALILGASTLGLALIRRTQLTRESIRHDRGLQSDRSSTNGVPCRR